MKYYLALPFFIFTSCGYEQMGLPEHRQGTSVGSGTSIDFVTVKAQVFDLYCLQCHSTAGGNRAGINLETYANVKSIVARIDSAVRGGVMPPRTTLPAAAKDLLIAWIEGGAPEEGQPNPGGTNPPPTPPPPSSGCEDDFADKARHDCDDDATEDHRNQRRNL